MHVHYEADKRVGVGGVSAVCSVCMLRPASTRGQIHSRDQPNYVYYQFFAIYLLIYAIL